MVNGTVVNGTVVNGTVVNGPTISGAKFDVHAHPAHPMKGAEMAFDEKVADTLRQALSQMDGITEKKMFGGLCFLLNGNMLCGVHKAGGMARVGKQQEDEALLVEGVDPLSFTGRKMGGMVDVSLAAIQDRKRRSQILKLAIDYVSKLPPK